MKPRESQVRALADGAFDVLVVGGGINGAVSAAALATRGAKTALIDRRDFAGFTSQESSNLVWGGIKYLESYDFALVRQLCLSRNQLLESYPTRVEEIRFLATIGHGFRHRPWKLWAAAWAYWLVGNGRTRGPRLLTAGEIKRTEPAIDVSASAGGIEYSDAFFRDNDARFVWDFVRTALDAGCCAANYVESLGSRREGDCWVTRVRDTIAGEEFPVRSRALLNATGPFADAMNARNGIATEHHHVYSKGIHLIVDRLTPSRRVLAFFADDGRLFFAIPMGSKTCIGTTDTRVEWPEASVTEADRRFVLDNINLRLDLETPLTERDIIAERCGVRSLAVKRGGADEGRDFFQLSRKHAIEADRENRHLSVYGGKLTDCINVGEEVCRDVQELGVALPDPGRQWFGEAPEAERQAFQREARAAGLEDFTAERLWRRYGPRASELLESIRRDPKEVEAVIPGVEYMRCEARYAGEHEMVTKLEDFLRRRTETALVVRAEELRRSAALFEIARLLFGDEAQAKIEEYLAGAAAQPAPRGA